MSVQSKSGKLRCTVAGCNGNGNINPSLKTHRSPNFCPNKSQIQSELIESESAQSTSSSVQAIFDRCNIKKVESSHRIGQVYDKSRNPATSLIKSSGCPVADCIGQVYDKSRNPATSLIKSSGCPVADCIGMGNINKPNFGGTHSSERSCPKKLQNNLLQSEQTIETLRNENLDLKTQLMISQSGSHVERVLLK